MTIHISPTERPPISELGIVSSLPEKYGADVLMIVRSVGLVGCQRKTFRDLVNSVRDGRLGKECSQMKQLDLGVMILEGSGYQQWTSDGQSLIIPSWSKAQQFGVTLSIQSQGYWIVYSSTPTETCEYVLLLKKWLEKPEHSLLKTRPKPQGEWGTTTNDDWAIHLLTSFEGVNTKLAGRILAHFGHVPLRWTVGIEDLMRVHGIGEKRALSLLRSIDESELT